MYKFILLLLMVCIFSSAAYAQAPIPAGPLAGKTVKPLDVEVVSDWLAQAFKKVPITNKDSYVLDKYFIKVSHPEKFNLVVESQDNLRFVSEAVFEKDLPAVISLRCGMSNEYILNDFNDAEMKRYQKILMFAYNDYKELYSETLQINGLAAMRTLWTFKYHFKEEKKDAKKDEKKGESKEEVQKEESVLMVGSLIHLYYLNFRYQFYYEVPASQYYRFRSVYADVVKNSKIRRYKEEDKKVLQNAFKYLAEKKFKEAYKEFEVALKNTPEFYPAIEGKYYSYLSAGKDKEALALLESSQKKFPNIDNFFLKEFDYYKAAKDEENLNKVLKKVFESSLRSPLFYTEAAFYLATKPQVKDKLINALLNHANNIDPLNSMAWVNTAKYFLLKQEFALAEAFYRQVLKLEPATKEIWIYLSEVYQKMPGGSKKAVDALRKLAYLYAEDVDALTLLANALVKDGQVKEAVLVFNKVFSIDPDYIPALSTVGLNMYQMQDYKNALSCFENIHRQKPEDYHVMNYLGMCYYFTGDINKAKALFDKMIAMSPKIDFGYMGLALVNSKQDKLDDALKCLDKVLSLNPDNRYARQMRATVIRDQHNKKK